MQAEINELIHVKLDGTMLEILLRIDPSYERFVTYECNKKVVYRQLDKVLYGALQSAKLFWEKLTKFFVKDLEFEVNLYDCCVVNKTINDSQFTIAWYVNDLKLSHVDPHVVKDIFAKLEAEYRQEAPLSVTCGVVHNYLGMVIDYLVQGKVSFTMPDLVDQILGQLPDQLSSSPDAKPAANHLFQTNTDAAKLSPEESNLYHRVTAQLFYLSKRARPDLLTAVAFLTTRVQAPDVDDFWKLGRCVRYLRRMAHYPLTLEATSLQWIWWWVDRLTLFTPTCTVTLELRCPSARGLYTLCPYGRN